MRTVVVSSRFLFVSCFVRFRTLYGWVRSVGFFFRDWFFSSSTIFFRFISGVGVVVGFFFVGLRRVFRTDVSSSVIIEGGIVVGSFLFRGCGEYRIANFAGRFSCEF